ncbi:MAG: Gfo/Idh/MocA family oxidoreductase [Thermomicrobiales bacterium]
MTLRIVQAGIGGHGKTWLTLLQRESAEADAIDLVAVADPSDWARAVAEEDGIPSTQIYASLGEALRFVDADAILIVTPPATHRAVATAALQAGKHVLIEKPLATTIDDARALADLAAERGLTLMVSQNYRYQAPVRGLCRLLDSGDYGTPVAIEITFMKDSRAMWPAENFRYAMDHPLLLDMSIHHLDMLRAITGRNARTISVESWKVPDSPYQGDVSLAALIRMEDDLPVVYRCSWASVGPQTTWNGDWRVLTDRGRLAWVGWAGQDHEDQLVWQPFDCRGEPEVLRQEQLARSGFAGSLHAFVESIATGSVPQTSAADNLHSLAMLFAGVESAERGGSVTIG